MFKIFPLNSFQLHFCEGGIVRVRSERLHAPRGVDGQDESRLGNSAQHNPILPRPNAVQMYDFGIFHFSTSELIYP